MKLVDQIRRSLGHQTSNPDASTRPAEKVAEDAEVTEDAKDDTDAAAVPYRPLPLLEQLRREIQRIHNRTPKLASRRHLALGRSISDVGSNNLEDRGAPIPPIRKPIAALEPGIVLGSTRIEPRKRPAIDANVCHYGIGDQSVDAVPAMPMPQPSDSDGLLYCYDHHAGEMYGHTRLQRPTGACLTQMEQVLQLFTSFCPASNQRLRAEDLLFIDLETTGLSRSGGTIAFLIGIGSWLVAAAKPGLEPGPGPGPGPARSTEQQTDAASGCFQVEQFLLRDAADEPCVLELLQHRLSRARVIVSFNGRGFDLPLLTNRSLLSRITLDLDKPHLDLLQPCRRLFRQRLSNCRLTTMERQLLGFERRDDVPGSEAPGIYFKWCESGQPGRLPHIMNHNRLDILLMAPLLQRLTHHVTDPLGWAEDGDELLANASIHQTAGVTRNAQLAEACLRRGLEITRRATTRRALLIALARHLRRCNQPHDAATQWEQLRREFPHQALGYIELAKYHEHVTKDLGQALDLVQKCPNGHSEATAHRLRRLQRRMAASQAAAFCPASTADGDSTAATGATNSCAGQL